jgi:iron only hydrogenase large subunit-like protein
MFSVLVFASLSETAQDISLIEAREEFVHRFRLNQQQEAGGASAALPVLASECPGWICYAEKSQADALPHISAVKSPQQIMGTLVKQHLAHSLGVSPALVYHVTLMPCYDKKLEASRDDFFLAAHGTREVDCVLATNEVVELLAERTPGGGSSSGGGGGDFASVVESPLDALFSNVDAEQQVLYAAAAEAGGSGGYLEAVFRHAARTLFAVELPALAPLPYRAGRNADTREVALEVDGAKVLSFATAYGFRNIQNVTRQVKTGALKHQYVEIMACPAGCLNGGGQIKAADVKSSKELLRAVDAAFHPAAAAAVATATASAEVALSDLAPPPALAADAQRLQCGGASCVRVRDPADNPAVQERVSRVQNSHHQLRIFQIIAHFHHTQETFSWS